MRYLLVQELIARALAVVPAEDRGRVAAEVMGRTTGRRRGGVSAERAAQIAERDRLLRRVWRGSPDWSSLPPRAAAKAMALSAARYERRSWARDRHMPGAPAGEPAATWWRVLRTGRMPGEKQLVRILSAASD